MNIRKATVFVITTLAGTGIGYFTKGTFLAVLSGALIGAIIGLVISWGGVKLSNWYCKILSNRLQKVFRGMNIR